MSQRNRRPSLLVALAIAIAWACQQKSPVEPTPPPAPCTFALSATSLSFTASGGTASVTVTTAASCAWTATSDRGWMTIDSGAIATGSGTVRVSLTRNAGTQSRSGTLTVAGQAVGVNQDGAEICAVSVSPAAAAFGPEPDTGEFTVTAPDSCGWNADSNDVWITIRSGATGMGTAIVVYAIARNAGPAARTGTIHVAGVAFAILQQGPPPPVCEFHVSPVLINACMAVPYELSVTVATEASCGWTAASDMPWLAMSGSTSRSGPGEIRFRVGDNYDAPRLGVVKVRWDTPTAGQNVQVSQAGCRYAVSTTGVTVPADGGRFAFDVYQQSDPLECGGPLQNGCVWTAVVTGATWITITTPMPRAGDDRVSFLVSANPGAARMARITVRDQSVAITQNAR